MSKRTTDKLYEACVSCNIDEIQKYINSNYRLNFVKSGKSPFEILLESENIKSIEALKLFNDKHIVFPETFDILKDLSKNIHKIEKFKVLNKCCPQLFQRTDFHGHLNKLTTLLEYEIDRSGTSELFQAYIKNFLNPMTYDDQLHMLFHLIDKLTNSYVRYASQKRYEHKLDIHIDAYNKVLDLLVEIMKKTPADILESYASEMNTLYEKLLYLDEASYKHIKHFETHVLENSLRFSADFVNRLKSLPFNEQRFNDFRANKKVDSNFLIDCMRFALTHEEFYKKFRPFLLENSLDFAFSTWSLDDFLKDLQFAKLPDEDLSALSYCAAEAMLNNNNFKLFEYKTKPQRKLSINI